MKSKAELACWTANTSPQPIVPKKILILESKYHVWCLQYESDYTEPSNVAEKN